MKAKIIISIILAVLSTVLLMQNIEPIPVHILWQDYQISKALLLGIFAFIGFLLGVIVAYRSKKETPNISSPNNMPSKEPVIKHTLLSDEDHDFLN